MEEPEQTEDAGESQLPTCFVICPIGDQAADIGSAPREVWENTLELFEEVIQPACTAFGLEPIRADRIARTGEILEQICRHLRDDDIVIADLTGGNPNVMYELGLRHTTGKLTIQLGESGKLPFDVSAIRTIMFQRSERGLVQARKRLSEVLSVGLSSGGDLATATRIWLDKPNWPAPSSRRENSDEPGFLEKLTDLEEHVGRLPENMTLMGEIMNQMNDVTTEIGERTKKANANGAPASARLALANELAERLTPHAERLDEVATDYQLAVEKVDPGVRHILGIPSSYPERAARDAFRSSVRGALPPIRDYIKSAEQLVEQLEVSGEMSRSVRRVYGRTRNALVKMIKTSEKTLGWGDLLEDGS